MFKSWALAPVRPVTWILLSVLVLRRADFDAMRASGCGDWREDAEEGGEDAVEGGEDAEEGGEDAEEGGPEIRYFSNILHFAGEPHFFLLIHPTGSHRKLV